MSAGVLIVEDEPLLRSMAVEFLSEAGLVTFEADNAIEALDLLNHRAAEVAVLFTDVRMPGGWPRTGARRTHLMAVDSGHRHLGGFRQAF